MTSHAAARHERRRPVSRGWLRNVWDHLTGRCVRDARRKAMDTNERNCDEIERLLAKATQRREIEEAALERFKLSINSALGRKEDT